MTQLNQKSGIEAVTVSEAIERHKQRCEANVAGARLVDRANFNVWIGAREDNRAWDYLHTRENFMRGSRRQLHRWTTKRWPTKKSSLPRAATGTGGTGRSITSANDREFDELYRKHLSNVYQALGAMPPDYLAQPINRSGTSHLFTPQSAYIHPHITGDSMRYFEWMGAAVYTPNRRAGAMHGKQFLLDSVHAGVDESYIYGRVDFVEKTPESDFELVVNIESMAADRQIPPLVLRLEVRVEAEKVSAWSLNSPDQTEPITTSQESQREVAVALGRTFQFKLPLSLASASPNTNKIRLRISLWQNRLPKDSLPEEGWMELAMEVEP